MIRVLIVDDDFMVARVNRGYVERVPGFEVVGEAHSAAGAIERCRELRPDLVLLDIYLPDRSGLDVLHALRDAHAPVDVLVVTAAREVETVRAALHGGVVGYLVKPFTFAALRERMTKYAEARRQLSASDEVGQAEVDRVFGLIRSPATATLPKGLSAATCAIVEEALRTAGGDLSASEAAELAGLSRVSARRYLEHLVETGRARLRPRYGGTGRPEHRYSWVG